MVAPLTTYEDYQAARKNHLAGSPPLDEFDPIAKNYERARMGLGTGIYEYAGSATVSPGPSVHAGRFGILAGNEHAHNQARALYIDGCRALSASGALPNECQSQDEFRRS